MAAVSVTSKGPVTLPNPTPMNPACCVAWNFPGTGAATRSTSAGTARCSARRSSTAQGLAWKSNGCGAATQAGASRADPVAALGWVHGAAVAPAAGVVAARVAASPRTRSG